MNFSIQPIPTHFTRKFNSHRRPPIKRKDYCKKLIKQLLGFYQCKSVTKKVKEFHQCLSRVYNEIMIYDKELSDKVIGCAFEVYNILGNGYLEKVYEKALLKELALKEIDAVPQKQISINYKGSIIGDYYADILVENKIILELKCCKNNKLCKR